MSSAVLRSSRVILSLGCTLAFLAGPASAQEAKPERDKTPKPGVKPDDKPSAKPDDAKPAGDLVAIPLKLPKPAFKGTPKDVPPGTNLEPPRKGERPAFMAPKGATNIALGKPVKASD